MWRQQPAAAHATESGSPAAPTSEPAPALKVGLAYDIGGRGDKSFNDSAAAGLDKAEAELGVEIKELVGDPGRDGRRQGGAPALLAQAGYNPVIAVGFALRRPR